jgi:hypothetical protein
VKPVFSSRPVFPGIVMVPEDVIGAGTDPEVGALPTKVKVGAATQRAVAVVLAVRL